MASMHPVSLGSYSNSRQRFFMCVLAPHHGIWYTWFRLCRPSFLTSYHQLTAAQSLMVKLQAPHSSSPPSSATTHPKSA